LGLFEKLSFEKSLENEKNVKFVLKITQIGVKLV